MLPVNSAEASLLCAQLGERGAPAVLISQLVARKSGSQAESAIDFGHAQTDRRQAVCATNVRDHLFANLAHAADDVLVSRQLFECHRPTCMKFVGADTDFRAETKFAAISKSCRCVPVHRGGIDFVEEFLSARGVTGDDDIAMMRATSFYVRNRVFDVVHGAGSEDEIEIFRCPVFLARGMEWLIVESRQLMEAVGIGAYFHFL